MWVPFIILLVGLLAFILACLLIAGSGERSTTKGYGSRHPRKPMASMRPGRLTFLTSLSAAFKHF